MSFLSFRSKNGTYWKAGYSGPFFEVISDSFTDGPYQIGPGDGFHFTELGTGLTLDVGVRKDPEPELPTTLDKVLEWLRGKGVEADRDDALELMRIWNGWDGPPPENL